MSEHERPAPGYGLAVETGTARGRIFWYGTLARLAQLYPAGVIVGLENGKPCVGLIIAEAAGDARDDDDAGEHSTTPPAPVQDGEEEDGDAEGADVHHGE